MTDQQSKAEIFAKLPADVQVFLKRKAAKGIMIDATRAEHPLGLTDSKCGGLPYIAPDADCPRDTSGHPYFLFIQLNFADVAAQAGQHPDLPETGLLQIFLPCFDPKNYSLGIWDDLQEVRFFADIPDATQVNHQVLSELREWYGEIATMDFGRRYHYSDPRDKLSEERDARCEAFIRKYYSVVEGNCASLDLPFYVECALHFSTETVYPNTTEDEVDFDKSLNMSKETEDLYDEFVRTSRKNYLLGYPIGFCQGDSRVFYFADKEPPALFKPYVIHDYDGYALHTDLRLLFDFHTDIDDSSAQNLTGDIYREHVLMQFDYIIQIFITKEHLKNHDFSELFSVSNVHNHIHDHKADGITKTVIALDI